MSASQEPNRAISEHRVSALDHRADELYTPQSFLQRATSSMIKARYPVVAINLSVVDRPLRHIRAPTGAQRPKPRRDFPSA